MAGPLAGIRVLEFSQVIAAPFAGQILADLGAEVLKVEPPGGESWRLQSSFAPAESKSYQCLNRGKDDMTLRLDKPEAQEIVHRLVVDMDVVLINYRPDAPAKFHIDYATLSAIKPDLVYVDLTAFGRRGDWAMRPGYDGAVQAVSGLMAAEGKTRPDDGSPATISSSAVADYSSGYVLADAVISGLYHREMTGEGQMIECSLLASALNLQPHVVMEHAIADAAVRNPARDRRRERSAQGAPYEELLGIRNPDDPHNIFYRAYLTRDGGIVIAAETPNEISAVYGFFDVDPSTIDAGIVGDVERKIESLSTAEWVTRLQRAGIPTAPIQFSEEMTSNPHVEANGWIVELEHEVTGRQTQVSLPLVFSATPLARPVAAPRLGRDTRRILQRLGYSEETVARLKHEGII
ncbi:MAG TPA: CoA transferase [Pseudomonadales bacterium]|nr:CoA transferase [Pseudomonadales bacterium]